MTIFLPPSEYRSTTYDIKTSKGIELPNHSIFDILTDLPSTVTQNGNLTFLFLPAFIASRACIPRTHFVLVSLTNPSRIPRMHPSHASLARARITRGNSPCVFLSLFHLVFCFPSFITFRRYCALEFGTLPIPLAQPW